MRIEERALTDEQRLRALARGRGECSLDPGGVADLDHVVAALAAFAEWEEWLNLVVGLWVLVSPWVLDFANTTAMWVHIVIGIIVAVVAAIEVWMMRHGGRLMPSR
jgi:hypothetical protein